MEPEHIANLVHLLVSETGNSIAGQVFTVDSEFAL